MRTTQTLDECLAANNVITARCPTTRAYLKRYSDTFERLIHQAVQIGVANSTAKPVRKVLEKLSDALSSASRLHKDVHHEGRIGEPNGVAALAEKGFSKFAL